MRNCPGWERCKRHRFDVRDGVARHRSARHGTRGRRVLLVRRVGRRGGAILHRRGSRSSRHRHRLAERTEPNEHHHRQNDECRGANELRKRAAYRHPLSL